MREMRVRISVTAEIGELNLVTKDIVDVKSTREWYQKRYKEVVSSPERYRQWKIIDIVEDLDRWKLVLPKEWRREALRKSHDASQAGHLETEKATNRC